jgi:hypothetical protein
MRMRLVIPAVVFALSLGVAPSVGATPPTQATATYSTVSSFSQTPIRTADGNTTFAVVDTFDWMGGISGTAADTATITVHSDGLATARGVETCSSCTIGGRTGSYTAVFTLTGNATFTQIYTGHFTFISAAGGLAGLHGEGTFPKAMTLSFSYHFKRVKHACGRHA